MDEKTDKETMQVAMTLHNGTEMPKASVFGLRESERRFRMALANSPIVVFEQDLNLRYTWIHNPKLGYKASECVGRTDADVMDSAYAARLTEIKRGVIDTGKPTREEVITAAPGGPVEIYDLSVDPLRDEAGGIIGVICAATDITERKKAEQALQIGDQRFRLAMEMNATSCFSLDRDLRFTWLHASQVGFGGEDGVGKTEYAHFTKESADRITGLYRQVLESGERRRQDFRVQSLFKSDPQDFQIVVEPLRDEDGEITGLVAAATDITARKRAEELRHEAEEARAELLHVARLSDMSEVASGLAHEVSQPLMAILNFAAAGRRALSSTTEPTIARVIEAIEAQAKNAADILKRLRGFIEKRESQRYPEDLAKLIEDALALAAMRSIGRSVRIIVKPLPGDTEVNVDRVQILQVLVNFFRNASDAMAGQPDPELVIETTMEKPGVVRIAVYDNGPGVDPTVVDRLFTPFVTTKKFGMGVGLSLCKTIIQNHDGEIGCVANMPKGATFWFTLPIVELNETADDLAAAGGMEPTCHESFSNES